VYSPGGRRTAIEFTINTGSGRVESSDAGFVGEFYATDGVELCACALPREGAPPAGFDSTVKFGP
jgi:hypothetical protein